MTPKARAELGLDLGFSLGCASPLHRSSKNASDIANVNRAEPASLQGFH